MKVRLHLSGWALMFLLAADAAFVLLHIVIVHSPQLSDREFVLWML